MLNAQTASYVTGSVFTNTNPALSASYALTASHALNGGGSSTPTFPYTGSAIISGSLIVTGSTTSTLGFTGSLLGTSSWAESASQALTASFVVTAQTASYVTGSIFTSVNPALSASYALTASFYDGQSTVGANLITQASPSAIRYLRINADNSISQLTLAQLKTDLGLSSAVLTTSVSQSTNSAVDITGLGLSVEANSTYIGTLYVGTGCSGTSGVRFAFTFPVGATLNIGAIGSLTNNSNQRMEQTVALASGTLYPPSAGFFNNAIAQTGYVVIDFTLVTGANAGTFQPQFASGTNTQVSTIYSNTTKIKMEKIV